MMKICAYALAFVAGLGMADDPPKDDPPSGYCLLFGKVRYVQSHANYKVYVDVVRPNLRVKTVVAFPNDPGEWQIVSSHEDFSVQFVDNRANADFVVQFVQHYPGC